jgi:hypothetical protein
MGNEATTVDIRDVKQRPLESLRNLPALYIRASEESMTLSHLLENADPSHDWQDEDRKIGAFGRVIQASGFRFRSAPSEGIYADSYEKIYNDPLGRALIPEWGNHIWRKVRTEGWMPQIRPEHKRVSSVLESLNDKVGGVLKPYVDAAGIYNVTMEPGIQLADLVAFETAIAGDTYRRAYLDDPVAANVRLLRIAEVADIPRAKIVTSEHLVRLYKYGRGIEISYEAARRLQIDKIGFFLAQAAIQVEADRVAQAIDVLINGDGNAGTAATNYNQSTLDTGAVPTVKGFLAFKAKFAPPYQITHIFAREAELVNLQMLQLPNNNPLLLQVSAQLGYGDLAPLQDRYGARVLFGQTDAVATGVYLGIDARRALERVTEIGSDIQETTRFVERQTEALFFTENDGFSTLDGKAAKTWTMA